MKSHSGHHNLTLSEVAYTHFQLQVDDNISIKMQHITVFHMICRCSYLLSKWQKDDRTTSCLFIFHTAIRPTYHSRTHVMTFLYRYIQPSQYYRN